MTNAIRSELLKIRTLKGGWLTALGVAAVTLVALGFWALVINSETSSTASDAVTNAAEYTQTVFTAGQFFGLLLTMIFGVTLVTSEYAHQTATATFLATPRRGRVVLAKIVAGLVSAFLFFLLATILAVGIGIILLNSLGVSVSEGLPTGIGAVSLNAIAYFVWVIFGIGLGALIRNQIGAVVIAIVLYLGELGIAVVLAQLSNALNQDWINHVEDYLPGGASRYMTSIDHVAGAPPWWVATLILLAYGVVATVVGAFLTRSRDIT